MKIGFVMYFENCRMLRDFPDEQYAAVMRALSEYAERLAGGNGEEAYLARQKADLPKETAMALEFMAGSVRRDHQRYQETIDRRSRKQPLEKSTGRREAVFRPAVDEDLLRYI